jgi:hypothetical protein
MQKKSLLLATLFLLPQISVMAVTPDSLNIKMLGEAHSFVEQCQDVAISGDYAYVASGTFSGLRVLDVSNPAAPVEIGYAINGDPPPAGAAWMARRVSVSGNFAYVLYFDGLFTYTNFRLYVYEVSNPRAPRQMGYVRLPDDCLSLAVQNNYAYVTATGNIQNPFLGLKIIDISDPAHPAEAGSVETSIYYPRCVSVADNIAYVAAGVSLIAYDVTDPALPTECGRYSLDPGPNSTDIACVTVRDSYAYLLDSAFGVRVLDVSNPAEMREIGNCPHNFSSPAFQGIKVVANTLYYLQLGPPNCLGMLDVSDPTAPLETGLYLMPEDCWPIGFDCSNGCAIIAARFHGLRVVDVSSPGAAEEIGCYVPPHGPAFGVAASRDFAYVSTQSDSENLVIYDVSDPSAPTEVRSLIFEGRPKWISVYGKHLYVPGVVANSFPGVSVLDISNPAEPSAAAFWSLPQRPSAGVPMSVERYGNYAFVATAYGGVQIYEVSHLDQPITLGSWTRFDPMTNQDFGVRNVKVAWPYVFAPDQAYGLYVLDVSDPHNIVEVASYQTPGEAWWVDISPDRNYLYLADFTSGLRIFDVSDPRALVEVGFVKKNLEMVNSVWASEDSIYVTDSQGMGLRVYDVSDPTTPKEVAYHETPGVHPIGLALANGLIYVSECTHFEIFEIMSEPTSVADDNHLASSVSDYKISAVYPNPLRASAFNAATRIVFDLTEAGEVTLQLYDINGQKVRTLLNGRYTAGRYAHVIEASGLASGFYILRLEANGQTHSRRLTLIK